MVPNGLLVSRRRDYIFKDDNVPTNAEKVEVGNDYAFLSVSTLRVFESPRVAKGTTHKILLFVCKK